MIRKLLMSLGVAAALAAILIATVAAQDTPETDTAEPETMAAGEDASLPRIEPFQAEISQAVPVSLTIRVPGETGVQTFVVPLTLNLDIRLGFGPAVTASVAATTAVVVVPAKPITAGGGGDATPTPTREPATATPRPTASPTTAATATPTPAVTREPITATATPEATATPTATAASGAVSAVCPDPRAAITSPGVNEVLTGSFDVLGTAEHENFNYYKLEYAQGVDPNTQFAYLTDVHSPVVDGVLGTFDTTAVDNGLYMLRLTVVDNTGNFPEPCTVTVVVEN